MRWAIPLFGAATILTAQPSAEFFERRIRPVLAEKCYVCHNAKNATSKLALDSREGAGRGGMRGTLLVAGDPDSSLIIRALSYRDPQLKMPPAAPLPDAVVEDFREWVRQGAAFPAPSPASGGDKHWSLKEITRWKPFVILFFNNILHYFRTDIQILKILGICNTCNS